MNRQKVTRIVREEFQKKKVLVLGDLMVDKYVTGKVSRVSPEAPVPILNYHISEMNAGGAANVARNIKALGSRVAVAGIAAMDESGVWLRQFLQEKGIDVAGIVCDGNRMTTVKTRYATKGQQLLRVDAEQCGCIEKNTQQILLSYIEENINQLSAVVMSDYKKGVLESTFFVENVIRCCNENNVLVCIDSKSRNIEAFKNVDFVKPNNLELEEAVGIHITDIDSLNEAGKAYLNKSSAKALVVTRNKDGISVFECDKEREDFPAVETQVFDVTGAGDTVISTISLGMVSGLNIRDAIQLANLAASVVISKVGTATVSQEELVECINER